jgi:hypothetical protein
LLPSREGRFPKRLQVATGASCYWGRRWLSFGPKMSVFDLVSLRLEATCNGQMPQRVFERACQPHAFGERARPATDFAYCDICNNPLFHPAILLIADANTSPPKEICCETSKSDSGGRTGRGSGYLAASDGLPGDRGVGNAGPIYSALMRASRFSRMAQRRARWLRPAGFVGKAGPQSEIISDLPVKR